MKIEAYVLRKGVSEEMVEAVVCAANMDSQIICEDLIAQAEEFTDEELLAGVTLGGIYICPESSSWKFVRIHTDGMANELPANPSTTDINLWLNGRFANAHNDGCGLDNDPLSVKIIC